MAAKYYIDTKRESGKRKECLSLFNIGGRTCMIDNSHHSKLDRESIRSNSIQDSLPTLIFFSSGILIFNE